MSSCESSTDSVPPSTPEEDEMPVMESLFHGEKRKAFLLQAEQHMLQALELLDDDLVCEYRQAMKKAPALVMVESKPMDFLRVEDYHPYRSAARLARHWKCRKEIFGPDRWLMPLRQKEGAMSPEAVEALQTGYMSVMTEPQPIIFVDYSRIPEGIDHVKSQVEVFFYVINAAICPASQTKGFTVFHVITSRRRPLLTPDNFHYNTVLKSMPLRIRQKILAQAYEEGREHLLDYRLFEQKQIVDLHVTSAGFKFPVVCIQGHSQQETLELLQQRGLPLSMIPTEYGGGLDVKRVFREFMQQRLSMEEQSLSVLVAASSPSSWGEKAKPDVLVQRLPGESLADFRKRRNVIYGRRNLEKERRKERAMEEQRKELQTENKQLIEENKRLEVLLSQARLLIPLDR